MTGRATDRALDWLVPALFGLVLCLAAPLRTALEFGADEGYELMKAFLVSRGHPLYHEIWNDQPPLHTELVAFLFQVFGPSAYVARLLSVGFAMVLVGTMYRLVRRQSGRVAGLVAVGLLVSSSFFFQLSVSVMLELPAMALAMAAVVGWTNYLAGKGRWWLVISGVLFGCALQVKLTAVIFVPALAADYLVRRIRQGWRSNGPRADSLWKSSHEAMVWCAAVLLAFGAIVLMFYGPSAFRVFLGSHFSEATRMAVASDGYAFRWDSALNELALWVSAVVGIGWIGFKRRWELLLPVVLLATVLAVHLWHRPYWYYYGLHFAIPLAWLGAVGIVEWFRALWKLDVRASLMAKLRFGMGWLGWSMLVSLVLTLAPERAWHELRRLSAVSMEHDDPMVMELRKDAARTRWVFADRVIYAFWAGLPVPPELAVIPHKRIWSGQLTEAELLKCLERYRPEQMLLWSSRTDFPGLSNYVQAHYETDSGGSEWFWRRKNELSE